MVWGEIVHGGHDIVPPLWLLKHPNLGGLGPLGRVITTARPEGGATTMVRPEGGVTMMAKKGGGSMF